MFAEIQDGAVTRYPLTFADLRREHPDVTFPEDPDDASLAPLGLVRVRPSPKPLGALGYDVRDAGPILRYGEWVQNFAVEPLPMDAARAVFKAALAEVRWRRETGGIVLNGVPVRTDRESQAMLSGAVLGAQIAPEAPIRWKGADGVFRDLDAATITAIGIAVRAHVQACFSYEADLSLLIDAAETVADLTGIDINSGWPGETE